MSSILDALSKVEAAERSQTQTLPLEPMPVARPRRIRTALLVAAAFAGGAAVAAGLVWRRAPVAAKPDVTLAIAPPVPAPAASDQPWASIDQPVAAPRAEPPPPTPVVRAEVVPARAAPPPTAVARPPIPAPAPPAAVPDPLPAPPPAPVDELRTGPPPRVRVSFLAYSALPERRTVALAVEDGAMVTLREGGRSGDVEVVRILPDRVDLRRNGITFTVMARD
ncbi:MAG: hypothetical protein U0807_14830 [Candidatus Binatia bacterium]